MEAGPQGADIVGKDPINGELPRVITQDKNRWKSQLIFSFARIIWAKACCWLEIISKGKKVIRIYGKLKEKATYTLFRFSS